LRSTTVAKQRLENINKQFRGHRTNVCMRACKCSLVNYNPIIY